MKRQDMDNIEPVYVYLLINPSFHENWVKISKSSSLVNMCSKELDNTVVPLPFEIFATMKTTKLMKYGIFKCNKTFSRKLDEISEKTDNNEKM